MQFDEGEILRPFIAEALAKAPTGKATGGDNLFVEMFRADQALGTEILTKIWEKVGEMGHIPQSWQESILIPVYKKGDASDPANFRPIALLSQARKIIESALDICLRRHYKFNSMQTGFQKHMSTATAIIRTLASIK